LSEGQLQNRRSVNNILQTKKRKDSSHRVTFGKIPLEKIAISTLHSKYKRKDKKNKKNTQNKQ
jgi:hypothetical protein